MSRSRESKYYAPGIETIQRERFDEIGLKPDDVTPLDDVLKIPLFTSRNSGRSR
jgi:hypothetical protein